MKRKLTGICPIMGIFRKNGKFLVCTHFYQKYFVSQRKAERWMAKWQRLESKQGKIRGHMGWMRTPSGSFSELLEADDVHCALIKLGRYWG